MITLEVSAIENTVKPQMSLMKLWPPGEFSKPMLGEWQIRQSVIAIFFHSELIHLMYRMNGKHI